MRSARPSVSVRTPVSFTRCFSPFSTSRRAPTLFAAAASHTTLVRTQQCRLPFLLARRAFPPTRPHAEAGDDPIRVGKVRHDVDEVVDLPVVERGAQRVRVLPRHRPRRWMPCVDARACGMRTPRGEGREKLFRRTRRPSGRAPRLSFHARLSADEQEEAKDAGRSDASDSAPEREIIAARRQAPRLP